MRIAIVTPSAAFAQSAGARIRYGRLARATSAAMELVPLLDLTEDFDAYLISKAHQPIVPALAAHLRAAGKPVALDVFDDYVTQDDDARLLRYRRWFADLAPHLDGLSVSTDILARRLAPRVDAPCAVVADPGPEITLETLAGRLAERAPATPSRLHFGWFGIASNPYFPAGLSDLAAFASALAAAPGEHRLTVLTNAERASDAVLTALARAPVPVTIAPWSEAQEAALTASVDAVLLPVSAGAFNTAKSLNRAVTALAGGTQVIALGAPIYAALSDSIYTDVAEFVSDAARGCLRHRAERVPALLSRLEAVASAPASAGRLLSLLRTPPPLPPVAALVLGGADPADAPGIDLFTIRTAASPPFDADVAIGFDIALSERAAAALPRVLRKAMRRGRLSFGALNGARGIALAPPRPVPRHAVRRLIHAPAHAREAQATARALFPHHTLVAVGEAP